jgi:sirohydrochlorin ferrochelatase
MPATPRTVVVLVAHGSRAPGANEAHLELARSVSEAAGLDVRPAFLELADPSIPDAIDDAIGDGATRVLVQPHFLAPGNHTTRDIPDVVEEARRRHPGIRIDAGAHTGSDPALPTLVANGITAALEGT